MRATESWRQVADAWFPPDLAQAGPETHHRLFAQWFDGGVLLPQGCVALVAAALAGRLDAWAATAPGRLALVLLLDQAPRQMRAGTPGALAGEADALRITEEGLRKGHYDALQHPWERTFLLLPIAHAEGPDHRERMIRVTAMAEAVAWSAPEALRPLYRRSADRLRADQAVIARFGRYPHRNAVLGRRSTMEEAAYMATGELAPRRRPQLAATPGAQPADRPSDRSSGSPWEGSA